MRSRYRRRPGFVGATCLRHPGRSARWRNRPPGWRGESHRHSMAARGIFSTPKTVQARHSRYEGAYHNEAHSMGRRLKRAGVTDREELEWEVGPAIREMAGYEDRNYTGRFGHLPRGSDTIFIKQKEQDLWNEFWSGYNA